MSFTRLPFEEVFADESGGNVKTPQGEYLLTGSFPVVDQGKSLIGGYVNDASRLCGGGRPAIVFGDHTRCVKYVDFPFCMGADGVKVLRPKIDADLKYLYHYLQTIKLPDGGYDRHYKYLKRTEVVIPPVSEQRRIAAILDQAHALRVKRREALALLDELQRGIFIEMFGDPLSNPKNWPVQTLENFFRFRTGKLDSNAAVAGGEYPFFTCAKEDLWIDTYAFDCEALLLAGNNANADYSVKHFNGKFNAYQRTYVITLKSEEYSYKYAAFFLEHHLSELKRMSKGSSTKYLTLGLLNKIRIPVPPSSLQRIFEERVEIVAHAKSVQLASQRGLDGLFNALQYRAFRGEL
ncbi:MAG: restriction endonuclease subunit S [Proteobacteria bacterium]|nr:restriction endonuclease subunit S [Pseudomonadota bacterium]